MRKDLCPEINSEVLQGCCTGNNGLNLSVESSKHSELAYIAHV